MPELDDTRREAYRAFLAAHSRLTTAMDKALTESGLLPLTWYDVLVTLEYQEGHQLRLSDLADKVLLSKSGLTRLVDRLVEQGYVERVACPKDRRSIYAVLTYEGQKAREDAWPTYSRLIQGLFGGQMTDGEAKLLTRVMLASACAAEAYMGRPHTIEECARAEEL